MSIADKLTTIAENQQRVYDAGKAAGGGGGGYDEGYEAGREVGFNEGYLSGQDAESMRFWGAYQNNGNPKIYQDAFRGASWTDETYTPLFQIKTTTGAYDGYCMFMGAQITDTLCPITVNGAIAMSLFEGCTQLKRIAYLTLNGVTNLSSAFSRCSALEEITIGGSIDVNVSFAQSDKLNDASVQSIIDHLKDLTGATARTLTLHATVGGKLTDAQKASITAKNWTLVY